MAGRGTRIGGVDLTVDQPVKRHRRRPGRHHADEDADDDDAESTMGPPVPRTFSRVASEVNEANRLPKAEASEDKVSGPGSEKQLGDAFEYEPSSPLILSGPVCKLG